MEKTLLVALAAGLLVLWGCAAQYGPASSGINDTRLDEHRRMCYSCKGRHHPLCEDLNLMMFANQPATALCGGPSL